MSISEAASVLHLSEHTIRNWLSRKKLKRVKIGGRTFLHQAQVEAILTDAINGKGERRWVQSINTRATHHSWMWLALIKSRLRPFIGYRIECLREVRLLCWQAMGILENLRSLPIRQQWFLAVENFPWLRKFAPCWKHWYYQLRMIQLFILPEKTDS